MTHAPLRAVPAGLLCGSILAAGLGLATRTPAQAKYMDVDDVKPGMKGYGLTVFSGTKPERFEVEIVSTMKNFRPGQSLYIVKTDHPRLRVARTVAGMSGSPVYIDGKMIGAYAYGWYFGIEPIAGVTPIQNMLADLKRPVPKQLMPLASRDPIGGRRGRTAKKLDSPNPSWPNPFWGPNRFAGKVLDYQLEAHAGQVARRTQPALRAPGGTSLGPAATDVMVGGLSSGAVKLAEKLLSPIGMNLLQVGGGGGAAAPAGPGDKFVDGGVITVQLAAGDVSLSGLGTVTHVVGDKLVAFGHPMMNGGIEYFPTALGRVHWILATHNRSFKIGEPTKTLGTLVNDRQASIVVETGRAAPTIPLSVKVTGAPGAPKTDWTVQVSHDQFLGPALVAVSVGSVLETTAGERNDMTWRAESKLDVEGFGAITLHDFGVTQRMTIGPSDFARGRLMQALGALLNNPWGMARIKSIETKVEVIHKRETSWLRGSQLLESEIDAGGTARVRLTLEPFQGQRYHQVIDIPLPKELAGKTVQIKLKPAYLEQRLVATPESMSELVSTIRTIDFPAEAVVASFDLPDESATAFKGNVASRLPAGAVDTLISNTDSVSPLMVRATKQIVIPIKGYMIGTDTVSVKVREVLR